MPSTLITPASGSLHPARHLVRHRHAAVRPPVQSASSRRRLALEHARAERLVPHAPLEHEVQPIAQLGPVGPREHAAVAERARTVLHASLKPHHDPSVVEERRRRERRGRRPGRRSKPAVAERRRDRRRADSRGRDRGDRDRARSARRCCGRGHGAAPSASPPSPMCGKT